MVSLSNQVCREVEGEGKKHMGVRGDAESIELLASYSALDLSGLAKNYNFTSSPAWIG